MYYDNEFILEMEEATRECRAGGLWELLYVDDLAQEGNSKPAG